MFSQKPWFPQMVSFTHSSTSAESSEDTGGERLTLPRYTANGWRPNDSAGLQINTGAGHSWRSAGLETHRHMMDASYRDPLDDELYVFRSPTD